MYTTMPLLSSDTTVIKTMPS